MASEKILINGVSEILKKLLPVISQQISHAWGVKDDLRKLESTLKSIEALILDAEEKQISDTTVRLWLRKLKDVVYDADDVMDEICHEAMHRSEKESQLKHKVSGIISKYSDPIVFNFKMAVKIRAIKKSLDEIHNDQVRYTLNSTGVTSQGDQTREHRIRLTASGVNDSVLIGREDASSDIVRMLTDKMLPSMVPSSSQDSSYQGKLSAISIVGMGGLGKTSLAQLVYKDESVQKNFEKKLWVCVSDKFDVHNILQKIKESLIDSSCGNLSNIDVLARHVKENLSGKKYLLVLDDLWNEEAEDWEQLKGVLVNGVEGSKLLVTTRSQKVASVIGGKVHNLQKLTDNVCWSIMQRKNSCPLPQNMIKIGREIAKKCDGLPLAANFLGNLLSLKREERHWVSINDDKNLWVQPENKRVISILKLSYDNLSSPLKQCFSYCCLFHKDWQIQRDILIRMWMAEGFLHSNEVNNRSFEDIGNDYFEFLLWNSFFQDTIKDELGVVLACKMHDLVHDLALSVVDRKEFGIDGKEDVSQVRRLQLMPDQERVFSTTTAILLDKAKKLRTVIVLHPEYSSLVSVIHPEYNSQVSSFSSAERLRILSPLNCWYAQISFSIAKFKHLRFLDLSNCEFDLSLDMSLNQSYNLQTLILQRCKNVSVFLGGIGHLKNLRHLDLSSSDIKVLHDYYIVHLTNLQTLDLADCHQFESLPENIGILRHLSLLHLHNTSISKIPDSITWISSLETMRFPGCSNLFSLPTELGALTRLRCLDLYGSKIKVLPESCIRKLCNLEIVDLGSCELPREINNWPKLRHFIHLEHRGMMLKGIEKLTCLEKLDSYVVREEEAEDIQVCGSTQNISASGHSGIEELAALKSLQMLSIQRLENVRGIEDAERAKLKDKANLRDLYLYGSSDDMVLEGLQPHPNLRRLVISGFSGLNLPKWMGSSSKCLLPNLVELNLWKCKRCEKLPALGLLPALRNLVISEINSVKCLGEEFYYQQQEEEKQTKGTNNSATTSSTLFPSLVELKIIRMENLEKWVSAPPSYDSFPLLEKLEMKECRKLETTPNSFPSLKELILVSTNGKAVHSILSGSRGGFLTSLTSIHICNSSELIYLPLSVLLRNNAPNLYYLNIEYCHKFQGFRDDDDDLYNSNRSSSSSNSNSNSSLHKLELGSCPVLTSLPDLGFWTSLRELVIWRCDKLKEYIPYDYKTSLSFLRLLKVDFIQREDPRLPVPDGEFRLINLLQI